MIKIYLYMDICLDGRVVRAVAALCQERRF